MYKLSKIDKQTRTIKRITRIITILVYIIIIPVFIINLTLVIKSFLNPDETPDFLGYKNFVIVSESMAPELNTNDVIFVKEVPQSEIQLNDIISFKQNDVIVTHRITTFVDEGETRKYITKGDQNSIEDEAITYEQIEGKYQFRIPGFGNVIEILQSKITLIIAVIILGLNYWNYNRIESKRERRSKKREQYKKNFTKNG